jgi:hypothetical protein
VRKTQKTPFRTARVSCHGRPRPSSRRLGRNSGSSNAHWTSVMSMLSIYAIPHKFQSSNVLNVFMRKLVVAGAILSHGLPSSLYCELDSVFASVR